MDDIDRAQVYTESETEQASRAAAKDMLPDGWMTINEFRMLTESWDMADQLVRSGDVVYDYVQGAGEIMYRKTPSKHRG